MFDGNDNAEADADADGVAVVTAIALLVLCIGELKSMNKQEFIVTIYANDFVCPTL